MKTLTEIVNQPPPGGHNLHQSDDNRYEKADVSCVKLELCVEKANGVAEADVAVVEVTEAPEREDTEDEHHRLVDLRQQLSVDVILEDSGQPPVNQQRSGPSTRRRHCLCLYFTRAPPNTSKNRVALHGNGEIHAMRC